MYGIIFVEFKKFIDAMLGKDAWDNLLKKSGVESKIYLANGIYTDKEIVALISTVSKMTGESIPAILEDFGEFIVPALLRIYKVLIKPEWRTLDVIEHAEDTIHKVVRIKNQGAAPPELVSRRLSPDEVVITYTSPRRMCALAKGIAKGLARHYTEQILITEKSCMLKGNRSCQISVKLK